MAKKPKKIKYKDNWVLMTGLFEIHWKNDKAVAVRIEGQTFYPESSKGRRKKV